MSPRWSGLAPRAPMRHVSRTTVRDPPPPKFRKAPLWPCGPPQPHRGHATVVLPLQGNSSLLLVWKYRVGVQKHRWRRLHHDLRSCLNRRRALRLAFCLSHAGPGSKDFPSPTTRSWGRHPADPGAIVGSLQTHDPMRLHADAISFICFYNLFIFHRYIFALDNTKCTSNGHA